LLPFRVVRHAHALYPSPELVGLRAPLLPVTGRGKRPSRLVFRRFLEVAAPVHRDAAQDDVRAAERLRHPDGEHTGRPAVEVADHAVHEAREAAGPGQVSVRVAVLCPEVRPLLQLLRVQRAPVVEAPRPVTADIVRRDHDPVPRVAKHLLQGRNVLPHARGAAEDQRAILARCPPLAPNCRKCIGAMVSRYLVRARVWRTSSPSVSIVPTVTRTGHLRSGPLRYHAWSAHGSGPTPSPTLSRSSVGRQ